METNPGKPAGAQGWNRLLRPIDYESPASVLVVTLVSLLLAEVVILAVHFLLPSFGLWLDIAVDLLLFLFLVGPILLVFLIFPLFNVLIHYKQGLLELAQAREELESRITERTAALVESNDSLQAQMLARELAENALREKESQLRLLIAQVPAILWSTGPDLTVTSLMGAGLADITLEPDLMIGKPLVEFIGTDDVDHAAVKAHRAALAGSACRYESQRDGVSFQNSIEPLRSEDGQIIGCLGIAINVTSLKQADERFRLQMAALESAADGIVITDTEGVIEWCNPAMLRMTGYSVNELLGSRMSLLNSGKHPPEFYTGLWETIMAGKSWQGVMHNRCKDGSCYYEEQTITPVVGQDGQISRFVAVKHDITERKQIEEDLLRHNWELQTLIAISEQVNQSLGSTEIYQSLGKLLSSAIPNVGGAVFSAGGEPGKIVVEFAWDASGLQVDLLSLEVPAPVQAAVAQVNYDKKVLFLPSSSTLGKASADGVARDAESPVAAHIITPFLFDEQLLGALWLVCLSLENKHGPFFEALGRQVGVGLKNALLYQQEIQSRQTAEIMSRASQALVQTLNLDKVLVKMLEYLDQAIPFDRGRILLREDGSRLAVRAVIDQGEPTITEDGAPFHTSTDGSHPFFHKIVADQKVVSVPDLHRLADRSLLTDWQAARSWLGLPVLAEGSTIGVCVLESSQVERFTDGHQHLANLLIGQAAVALQNAWLFNQLRDGRAQLQSLSRRLVDIQETERNYIARELHDETSQAIVNLKFGLNLLKQDIAEKTFGSQSEELRSEVGELELMVGEILQNLHQLASNLRPACLDHLGLVPALKQFIDGYIEKFGLPVRLSVEGLCDRLPASTETNLFRIVQESLTNIVRHANAKQVELALEQGSEKVIVIIRDDGTGFDPALVSQTSRLGILGMRERAEMLGGRFQIFSAPGTGTKIVVEVPHADSCIDR